MTYTLSLKQGLIRACRARLEARAQLMRHNMDEAQEEANAHIGAMASRYDTFKEEAQMRRDGYAVELDKTLRLIQALYTVPQRAQDTVGFGALVQLQPANGSGSLHLFVFASFSDEPLQVEDVAFRPISLTSPLGNVLDGRPAGATVTFRGTTYTVQQVI
ncbi:MAG: hypothetical protein D6685_07165 [Bacteroidetes bacterium]|nr:MAG: hypothetical protein D6685_07165 [Bacteroidota bacterium]